jgi:translation initiation factor 4G
MPRLQDQLSRPNSRRGQGRDGQFGVAAPGADGWSAPVPQRQAKAGDLSSFGKIREPAASISLGPSGAFANRARAKEAARPVTPSNPFAILSGGDASADASVSQRPVLNLLRRTKPMPLDGAAEEEKPEEEVVEEEEEEEDDGAIDPNAISMSRAEGERRADNSVKEVSLIPDTSVPVGARTDPVPYAVLRGQEFGRGSRIR